MKSLCKICLVGLSLLVLSSCEQLVSDTRILRLAHSLDINHPVHKAMEHMKVRLEALSEGKMTIQLYPSGQLGSERETLELLQIGSLAMTKVSASSLEAFVPEMKVFSVPYLFASKDHYWDVLQGEIGQQLLKAGRPYFFMGLGYYDAGSRSFYTVNAPVEKPADLKGMKIRVMSSQSAVNMVKTMGGSATPVSFGELYTALQQGVVDGAENNPPSFYLSKHFEVAKYYLLDEHTSIPDVLVVSTQIWQSLNPQQQNWLQQAADESVTLQRDLWQQATEEALAAVKASGVEVRIADKRPFADITQPIRAQYKGTDIGEIIDQIAKAEEPHE